MPEEIKQLRQQIEAAHTRLDSLMNSTSIPFEIDRAFRDRFRDLLALSVSAKAVDSEDVTVNESGSSSYAVMNDPSGFLQVTIAGTLYYIPYFS